MGQREIISWLGSRRLAGDDRYFTAKDIARGVDGIGGGSLSVRMNLGQLHKFGVVERRSVSMMQWSYRLRQKYVAISSEEAS